MENLNLPEVDDFVNNLARVIYMTHWRAPAPVWKDASLVSRDWSRAQALSVVAYLDSLNPDDWAQETAQMIIDGLLREEGWELPGTKDEEITTKRLIAKLKMAVLKRTVPI